MARPLGPDTEQRIVLIQNYLREHGESPLAEVARATGIPRKSMSGTLVPKLEREKVIVTRLSVGPTGKTRLLALPHQRDITAPRPPKALKPIRLPRKQLGADASEEVVEQVLKLYEQGHRLGPYAVSDRLGITMAEAISAIGKLRARGQIRNYGETFIPVVPFPKDAA
jgi:hypothetical protein